MLIWLGIIDENGIPIYQSSYGIPPPGYSFAHMALVSALLQSARESEYHPAHLTSSDCAIACKLFGSINIFIACSNPEVGSRWLDLRLDRIYSGLLLLIGPTMLKKGNPNALQRSVKAASSLLDLFLIEDDGISLQIGTGVPECIIPSTPDMVEHVESLSFQLQTPQIAIYARQRFCVGTKDWMKLDSRDLFSLSLLLFSCRPASSRDIPVYLNYSDVEKKKEPFRFLTVRLTSELELVMLCRSFPKLTDVISALPQMCDKRFLNDLNTTQQMAYRHVPDSIIYDIGILGFIFHYSYELQEDKNCSNIVTCFTASNTSTIVDSTTLLERKRKLMTFYYTCFQDLLSHSITTVLGPSKEKESKNDQLLIQHECTDSYMRTDENGYYAHRHNGSTIFVLFAPDVPFPSYRPLTKGLCSQLTPYMKYLLVAQSTKE